jgi:hypothetical protein
MVKEERLLIDEALEDAKKDPRERTDVVLKRLIVNSSIPLF